MISFRMPHPRISFTHVSNELTFFVLLMINMGLLLINIKIVHAIVKLILFKKSNLIVIYDTRSFYFTFCFFFLNKTNLFKNKYYNLYLLIFF